MTSREPAGLVPLEALLQHREWVRALARSLVADPHRADDVEQETWRMALERPPRHDGALRAWFRTVVLNAVRKSARSDAQRTRLETSVRPQNAVPSPADVIAEAEVHAKVVRAVLELDEPYCSTVLYRFFHGLEATEIAARTGVPVETVRTRLKRAIERLRERMDVELGDDRDAWCLLVLGHRRIPAAVPTGTGVALGAAGGVVMGAATKWAVGAVAVLLAAALLWTITKSPSADVASPPPPQAKDTAAAPPEGAKPSRHAAQPDAATAAPASSFPPPVDLASVDRDLDLHGVVVRKDGTPVPGAKVQIVKYPWLRTTPLNWDAAFLAVPGADTTSSSDGSFSLRLRRGELVSVRFTKDGLAPLELPKRQAGERVRALMEPGVRLVVAARDQAGSPAADVRLRLLRFPNSGDPSISVRGVTAADGTARFADLPGGCQALLMPESRLGNVGMKRIDLPASGETKFELVLPAGRTLRGRVTDADTGAAIGGARVGMAWVLVQATTTGADGAYALEGWTADGFNDIHVLADGYARTNEVVGSKETIDFALHRGFTATGRLVGPDGAPVPGACVSLVATTREGAVQRMSAGDALAGADGSFRVGGLDRTKVHVLTVFGPGFGRLQMQVPPPDLGVDEKSLGDIALSASRAIEAVATDATGAPVARAKVTLTGPKARGAGDSDRFGGVEERATDDLGRVRFPDLAPGAYVIAASPAGGSEITANVVLPADRDVLDVVLGAPKTRDVVVHVVDEAGAPLSGVMVSPQGMPGQMTDSKGVARFHADERSYEVYALPSSAMDAARSFLPPEPVTLAKSGPAEITFVFREAGVATGVVLDPDGKPVALAQIDVEPSNKRYAGPQTDAEGKFRAVLPRNGAFTLAVYGSGQKDGKWTDLLVEGRAENVSAGMSGVEIRCTRIAGGRELKVRVTTPDGKPLVGARVFVAGQSGARGASAKTGSDGRGTASNLTARPYRVQVVPQDGWIGPEPVEVIPDGQEIALTMRAAARITGVVVFSDGSPVPNASLMVYRGETPAFGANADEKGEFTALVPLEDAGPFALKTSGQDKIGPYRGETAGVRGGQTGVRIVVER
jgi:RNA polymerase sigma-70 factor (ECF subfamily)